MQPPLRDNPHYKSAQKAKRRIAVFCTAIMAAIAGPVAEDIITDYNDDIDRARVEAANLSAGFEEQLRGKLDGIRAEMKFLKRRIETEGPLVDLARWKSEIPEFVNPIVNAMTVDAGGRLVASSVAAKPLSFADRDFFQAHRDNPDSGLLLGPPHIGRIVGRHVITASMRLDTDGRRFAGVLVFSLDPALLTTLHQWVNPGKTAAINVLGLDGTILARYTPATGFDSSRIGVKVQGLPAMIERRAADAGEYTRPSPVDGVTRLHHWRKVAGYPLIVTVGLGKAEMLANTNSQTAIVIGLAIAALSLPLIMMLRLNREISRRAEQAIALDKEAERVREINAQLSVAQYQAEEANRAKSHFLANMSHELRTPLNAILGFSEIIRDKLFDKDVERYAHFAKDIHESGAHLLNIVNDVLDLSKIEAGRLELHEEEAEVRAIMQESLSTVEPSALAQGLSLVSNPPDSGVSIYGDKTKLKRIVINLLSNAIKFTPAGGSIAFSADADDRGLTLKIEDTGIGMSAEDIRQAVEPFRQVDNGFSRRFEGTGLGLPLAIQLTERHSGTLTIKSSSGLGTAIIVWFPPSRINQNGAAGSNGLRGVLPNSANTPDVSKDSVPSA
jgi:two-component system, cell cycle sensor histidine kinase PleC